MEKRPLNSAPLSSGPYYSGENDINYKNVIDTKYEAIQVKESKKEEVKEEDNKINKVKNYIRIAILVISIVLIVEAIINYDRIVPRFQSYLLWAQQMSNSWKGPLIFFMLYLIGILLFIPQSVLTVALGYTL